MLLIIMSFILGIGQQAAFASSLAENSLTVEQESILHEQVNLELSNQYFGAPRRNFIPETEAACGGQEFLQLENSEAISGFWQLQLEYLKRYCLFPFERDCRVLLA